MSKLTEEQKELVKESRKVRKYHPEDRTDAQSKAALRRKVRMFYDLQRLRIQTAGRTYNENRDVDVDLHDADIEVLKRLATDLHWAEKEALKDIEAHLKTIAFFTEYLTNIKGIGPTMAGVIIAEVDIYRCNTVSALWRYAGLAPVPARRCKFCQDTVVPVTNKEGFWRHEFKRQKKCKVEEVVTSDTYESAKSERPKKGEKLRYNKFLHSKLLGVLADVMLRVGSPYRSFYDNYKHRLVSSNKGRDDGHRHRMALRYMIKMLLQDIFIEWRKFEGLEVRPSYQEQYLGHTHHQAAQEN